MSLREERMAKNEAASREINERIEEAYQGEPPANRIDIVCECARMTCDAAIDITLDEYEDGAERDRWYRGARTGPRGGRWTGRRGRADRDRR